MRMKSLKIPSLGPSDRAVGHLWGVVGLFGVLILLIAAMGVAVAPVAHGNGVRPSNTLQNPLIQVSTTATRNLYENGIWYQNGTAQYDGSSNVFTYSTSVGTNTGILSSSATWLVNVQGGDTGQVDITQGTGTLANVTQPQVFTPFTIGPTVKEKLTSVFTSSGTTPSVGTYHFYTNSSFSISYLLTNQTNWRNSAGNYTNVYVLTPPTGFYENDSTVFIPYPNNVPANTSTINVSINSVWYRYWQTAPTGIYVTVASVSPSSKAVIAVNFTAYPMVSGPAPYITFNSYHVVSGVTYQTWANFVNTNSQVWAGIYILDLNLKYAVNPNTIVVLADGHSIRTKSLVVSDSTITILPFSVFTAASETINFTVQFQFLTAVPSASFADSSAAVMFGTLALTWGELFGILILLTFGHLVYLWKQDPNLITNATGDILFPTEEGKKVLAEHLVVIIVFVVILLIGSGV